MTDTSAQMRAAIRAAATERTRLHALGARTPEAAPELAAAYAANREFLEKLNSPEALALLSAGDEDALEYAACFLEVYPLCPDSGFAMRDLVRALRDTRIPANLGKRLRVAFLTIVTHPARDEMKHLRQLALRVSDQPFVLALDRLTESRDLVTAENSRSLANYIAGRRRASGNE